MRLSQCPWLQSTQGLASPPLHPFLDTRKKAQCSHALRQPASGQQPAAGRGPRRHCQSPCPFPSLCWPCLQGSSPPTLAGGSAEAVWGPHTQRDLTAGSDHRCEGGAPEARGHLWAQVWQVPPATLIPEMRTQEMSAESSAGTGSEKSHVTPGSGGEYFKVDGNAHESTVRDSRAPSVPGELTPWEPGLSPVNQG